MTASGLSCPITTGVPREIALDESALRVVDMIGRKVVGMEVSVPFGNEQLVQFTCIVIGTPVDVVGFLDFWCRSVVIVVFVDTIGMVIGTLFSEVKTVTFGFTLVTPLLTVFGSVVVGRIRFLVVFGLETIGNVVGVTLVGLLVIVTGTSVDNLIEDGVGGLEVVLPGGFGAEVCFVDLGALVVRVRPFLTVELVRLFFRFVKVVTLLRVGVTLGEDVDKVTGVVL